MTTPLEASADVPLSNKQTNLEAIEGVELQWLTPFHSFEYESAMTWEKTRVNNSIQKWADENGFQFSKSKTVCMHFTQLN